MHKGYIHIISQITLFLGKYLAWSAVCVSVPLQPYIVEICDSLRGKIFQKFIERWDSGVGGCEHSVEQSANVLLNPHFPSPPPTPKWQIYSFLPMEKRGAQHPCEYTFLCVFPLRVIRKHWRYIRWCAAQSGDIKEVYHFRSSCRHSCFSFVSLFHISVSIPLSAIQPDL